ncbi:hypothetical protein AVEN_327-1 [Araneus ventricosus]|uniref:Uncharacterized protein n=1 Tax=Araneus ventricosus TaxID=182803 RepID=A0A4Y2HYK3_ARAVE|nr:hypothetical protein AVEN_327-1 [Araneus ventricosus]
MCRCDANLGDHFGDDGEVGDFGGRKNILEDLELSTYFFCLHGHSGNYVASYVMKSLPTPHAKSKDPHVTKKIQSVGENDSCGKEESAASVLDLERPMEEL